MGDSHLVYAPSMFSVKLIRKTGAFDIGCVKVPWKEVLYIAKALHFEGA